MDWDLAIKIAGPLAAVSTIPVFFWTNLRNDVKRTAIIDLATKRIAFWNQLLTTVNLATVEDSPERKAERDKAYQAIQRIQEDATVQLQMLSRTRKVNRTIGWKSFRFERAKFRTWRDAVFWWYFVFLSVAMLCLSALIFVRIEYKIFARNLQGIHLSVDLLMNFAFIDLGRLFLYQAESLKHDSATAPIIDSI